MICWSLDESAGRFWQPAEFENVANPDFENLKHLKNPGNLTLTEPSILLINTSKNTHINDILSVTKTH